MLESGEGTKQKGLPGSYCMFLSFSNFPLQIGELLQYRNTVYFVYFSNKFTKINKIICRLEKLYVIL